uniref:Uncharacterized protein n=1 Tax=Ananas comosus var. bracteatus TaxID=296719 RepID=A0A6V7NUV7_ANACO|nr:unnamed protein product [Ananas comosus var. bracteatus]
MIPSTLFPPRLSSSSSASPPSSPLLVTNPDRELQRRNSHEEGAEERRRRRRPGRSAASHRALRERAKGRVDELQGSSPRSNPRAGTAAPPTSLPSRSASIASSAAGAPSSTSPPPPLLLPPRKPTSLIGNSGGSSDLSSYIRRMLQLNEEEDDATSKFDELPREAAAGSMKTEPLEVAAGVADDGGGAPLLEEYFLTHGFLENGLLGADEYKNTLSVGMQHAFLSCEEGTTAAATNFDSYHFNLHQQIPHNVHLSFDSELIPAICPPPSAFLRPKCALWDCPRPAQGSEWYQDYCSSFHATLAVNEGPLGMSPVLRPGGIDLKDGPLFAALAAKTLGKNVGIPECEGPQQQSHHGMLQSSLIS